MGIAIDMEVINFGDTAEAKAGRRGELEGVPFIRGCSEDQGGLKGRTWCQEVDGCVRYICDSKYSSVVEGRMDRG